MDSSGAKPFDRELLVRRRDRVAERAEGADFLLHRVGEDIRERLQIVQRDFRVALNLGAHNGVVSRSIRDLENVGLVIDADASEAFVSRCDGPGLVCDEEALPFSGGELDLVVSGLSLQLVNDLPGALVQIREALKPDGLFLAALLGGQTLIELRQAWLEAETEKFGGVSPRVAPFADVRALGALAQRAGFALPVVDSETITVTYSTPLALMAELKAMGASNMLVERARVPVTTGLLMRASEIYADRFGLDDGRIPATFEVLSLTAWVPHESQPQPLKPGSAQVSLEKVLRSTNKS